MPPRVAMLSVHTSPLDQPGTGDAGGMNVYVAELSRALARRGAEVEIFTRATTSRLPETMPLPAAGDPGPGLRSLDPTGGPGPAPVLVHHVPAGPFERLDKEDLPGVLCAMAAGVLRAGARHGPGWYDVVHSHYWLSGQVGLVAAERWRVPLVHTMHTMARVKQAALTPGDSPEPTARVLGEEEVVAAAGALVASTPEEAEDLVRLYGADPTRAHVVTPGVDLRRFSPGGPDAQRRARTRLGLPAHRPIVLFAGRVQPLKAPDVLVRALAELTRAGRPVPLLCILGGASGRPTAVQELQALADRLGVGPHVRVHPAAPAAELVDWYRAADLVAVPSRSESFGFVAAEAQACGTPVVAAAVGGLRTVVVDGVSGRLVHGHDPRRWAGVLDELLTDTAARARMAAAARVGAERFGWDAAAEQVLRVYRAARSAGRTSSGDVPDAAAG